MRNSPLSRFATIAVLAITLGVVPFAWGQYTETAIHNFTGGNDGAIPYSGLIFDAQGNLYGMTNQGGPYGAGSVFRLSPQSGGVWTETVLYDFSGGTDGGFPYGGLVLDAQGNLYGTTYQGGSSSCVLLYGGPCGVVFKLSPQTHGRWKETVLHAFQINARDGFFPITGLVFDSVGNLYGTTLRGGAYNVGVVFELTPIAGGLWKEKVLHSFTGAPDGSFPGGQLIVDAGGNLYGTTEEGGNVNTSTCTIYGCGVVFKLTPTSSGRWNEHVLYSFTNTGDGSTPLSGLTVDGAGNLYGTTPGGGNSTNCFNGPCGVVFEVSKGSGGLWTEQVLYNFQGGNDGWNPSASLIFDQAGNLYSTTYYGGGATMCAPYGCGTVFELSPSSGGNWTESIIYSFNGMDGCVPQQPLIQDSAGNLYGTVPENAAGCMKGGNFGAVFELTP